MAGARQDVLEMKNTYKNVEPFIDFLKLITCSKDDIPHILG